MLMSPVALSVVAHGSVIFLGGSGKKRIGGCADLRMLRQDKGWD